jgi:hypothetical protein
MNTILLHGNCGHFEDDPKSLTGQRTVGADWIAEEFAAPHVFNWNVWPLPYFADLGARGGPARNDAMFRVLLALKDAGFACFVEAFPIGKSPGTRGMLRIVESHNYAALRDMHQREKHHDPIPVCVTEGKP